MRVLLWLLPIGILAQQQLQFAQRPFVPRRPAFIQPNGSTPTRLGLPRSIPARLPLAKLRRPASQRPLTTDQQKLTRSTRRPGLEAFDVGSGLSSTLSKAMTTTATTRPSTMTTLMNRVRQATTSEHQPTTTSTTGASHSTTPLMTKSSQTTMTTRATQPTTLFVRSGQPTTVSRSSASTPRPTPQPTDPSGGRPRPTVDVTTRSTGLSSATPTSKSSSATARPTQVLMTTTRPFSPVHTGPSEETPITATPKANPLKIVKMASKSARDDSTMSKIERLGQQMQKTVSLHSFDSTGSSEPQFRNLAIQRRVALANQAQLGQRVTLTPRQAPPPPPQVAARLRTQVQLGQQQVAPATAARARPLPTRTMPPPGQPRQTSVTPRSVQPPPVTTPTRAPPPTSARFQSTVSVPVRLTAFGALPTSPATPRFTISQSPRTVSAARPTPPSARPTPVPGPSTPRPLPAPALQAPPAGLPRPRAPPGARPPGVAPPSDFVVDSLNQSADFMATARQLQLRRVRRQGRPKRQPQRHAPQRRA